MSLPALVFLLILTLFAALWEYLLWWAFRHGNRAVLLHSSGLVLLLFALPLFGVLYILLEKPFLYAVWPWTWVSDDLEWLLMLSIICPFVLAGIDLLWSGPKQVAASPPPLDWRWLWLIPLMGGLIGVIAGFHWISFPLSFLTPDQGHSPVLFGAFWLDEFWQGFFWGIMYTLPGTYFHRLAWWIQTFSERRWLVIGTTLLLLGILIIAVLLWN